MHVTEFLALEDPYRGIDTGMTGRIFAWQATWEIFLENPILGVGFRVHEQSLDVGSSAHNGYLTTLAEIGLFGFLSIVYLIVSGSYMLWRCAVNPDLIHSHSILFGIVSGYVLLAVFERYLINIGNPTSLLFLLGILTPKLAARKGADIKPQKTDSAGARNVG
jgi:O-antigen ligase